MRVTCTECGGDGRRGGDHKPNGYCRGCGGIGSYEKADAHDIENQRGAAVGTPAR